MALCPVQNTAIGLVNRLNTTWWHLVHQLLSEIVCISSIHSCYGKCCPLKFIDWGCDSAWILVEESFGSRPIPSECSALRVANISSINSPLQPPYQIKDGNGGALYDQPSVAEKLIPMATPDSSPPLMEEDENEDDDELDEEVAKY
ncbi:hypothetical protein RHMOL_Rhmol13G0278600 [Rhododendron molle]|uniref:Uncharacterized protein n=1 Tax=Rhododendron molle TaxID=49168 RepID=A0ACC0LBZ4_RHOML|nr:hypothetical protein RHMOL_Rhmol13G0278600 [Rhododendron molle]